MISRRMGRCEFDRTGRALGGANCERRLRAPYRAGVNKSTSALVMLPLKTGQLAFPGFTVCASDDTPCTDRPRTDSKGSSVSLFVCTRLPLHAAYSRSWSFYPKFVEFGQK